MRGCLRKMGDPGGMGDTEFTHLPLLQVAPVCAKCDVVRPCRFLLLSCSFTGSALLWWAFNLPTWVKVEVSSGLRVLFSALFAICSGEVVCWVPPSKSSMSGPLSWPGAPHPWVTQSLPRAPCG